MENLSWFLFGMVFGSAFTLLIKIIYDAFHIEKK